MWSASGPCSFPDRGPCHLLAHWLRNWELPRADLDVSERRILSFFCRESNHSSSVHNPVAFFKLLCCFWFYSYELVHVLYHFFLSCVCNVFFFNLFFLFTPTKVHLTPQLIFSKYQPASPIPLRLELELDESWVTASGTSRQLHINRTAPSICSNSNKIHQVTWLMYVLEPIVLWCL